MNQVLDPKYLDKVDAEIEIYNRRQTAKFVNTGLTPKLKKPITSVINARIYRPLHEKLQEVSLKTGVSQRRIIQDALVDYLERAEHREYKTRGVPIQW